jgi:hypothetical protein
VTNDFCCLFFVLLSFLLVVFSDPRAWWLFVCAVVRKQVQDQAEQSTWGFISKHFRELKRYVPLYRSKMVNKAAISEEQNKGTWAALFDKPASYQYSCHLGYVLFQSC